MKTKMVQCCHAFQFSHCSNCKHALLHWEGQGCRESEPPLTAAWSVCEYNNKEARCEPCAVDVTARDLILFVKAHTEQSDPMRTLLCKVVWNMEEEIKALKLEVEALLS